MPQVSFSRQRKNEGFLAVKELMSMFFCHLFLFQILLYNCIEL